MQYFQVLLQNVKKLDDQVLDLIPIRNGQQGSNSLDRLAPDKGCHSSQKESYEEHLVDPLLTVRLFLILLRQGIFSEEFMPVVGSVDERTIGFLVINKSEPE